MFIEFQAPKSPKASEEGHVLKLIGRRRKTNVFVPVPSHYPP